MILYTQQKYEKSLGKLNCSICGRLFYEDSQIFVPKRKLGYVCERCYIIFSIEEIEEYISLFKEFGGYFGRDKNQKLSLDEILKELFEILLKKENMDIIEANIKIRHKALLHGYRVEELIDKLKDTII